MKSLVAIGIVIIGALWLWPPRAFVPSDAELVAWLRADATRPRGERVSEFWRTLGVEDLDALLDDAASDRPDLSALLTRIEGTYALFPEAARSLVAGRLLARSAAPLSREDAVRSQGLLRRAGAYAPGSMVPAAALMLGDRGYVAAGVSTPVDVLLAPLFSPGRSWPAPPFPVDGSTIGYMNAATVGHAKTDVSALRLVRATALLDRRLAELVGCAGIAAQPWLLEPLSSGLDLTAERGASAFYAAAIDAPGRLTGWGGPQLRGWLLRQSLTERDVEWTRRFHALMPEEERSSARRHEPPEVILGVAMVLLLESDREGAKPWIEAAGRSDQMQRHSLPCEFALLSAMTASNPRSDPFDLIQPCIGSWRMVRYPWTIPLIERAGPAYPRSIRAEVRRARLSEEPTTTARRAAIAHEDRALAALPSPRQPPAASTEAPTLEAELLEGVLDLDAVLDSPVLIAVDPERLRGLKARVAIRAIGAEEEAALSEDEGARLHLFLDRSRTRGLVVQIGASYGLTFTATRRDEKWVVEQRDSWVY